MLSYPPFREDQIRVKDEDDTWLVFTSWGRRGVFESQGYAWAFEGSPNLPPRDTAANFDFVQLARDSFVAMAGHQEQWQSEIKFLCVHCDASSMMAADDEQEALVPAASAWFSPNHSVQDAQVGNVVAEPLEHAPYARRTGWQQRV